MPNDSPVPVREDASRATLNIRSADELFLEELATATAYRYAINRPIECAERIRAIADRLSAQAGEIAGLRERLAEAEEERVEAGSVAYRAERLWHQAKADCEAANVKLARLREALEKIADRYEWAKKNWAPNEFTLLAWLVADQLPQPPLAGSPRPHG